MYENRVYEEWMKCIHGIPTDYHKRLADRVVACLGNWLDESKVEDVICDMEYHRRQIEALMREDAARERYHRKP